MVLPNNKYYFLSCFPNNNNNNNNKSSPKVQQFLEMTMLCLIIKHYSRLIREKSAQPGASIII